MQITNNLGINLPLAVWLLHDEYDYINEPNYISATRLLRPLKHIVMGARVPNEVKEIDVSDFIARASGHAYHAAIEKAWLSAEGRTRAMKLLGLPEHLIERVTLNPTDEERRTRNDMIPVYIEQRAKRVIDGYTIGGKFDMVCDGILQDNKSTSAFTWVYGGRDDEHQLQGSLYRWLNPEKITEDYIRINYIFTDWNKMSAKQNPKYPQKRLESKDIPLLSIKETEQYIRSKLRLIEKYKNSPESEIPECTDEDLWRSEPAFKYYADPTKTAGRSTKNFDSLAEANTHLSEKAGKGIVITVPGEVKRCAYCDVFPICKQKDRYLG